LIFVIFFKRLVVRDYEKKLYDLRHEGDKINIRRREIIENFYYGKLLPEVRFIDILYEVINFLTKVIFRWLNKMMS